MPDDLELIARERERLLTIIAREPPQRKPGGRTRAWELDRQRAIERLRQIDAGAPLEDPDVPY